MKKKIEDYINKGDYAVLCSSIEEWNAIVDLINKNHVSTTTQPYSKTKSNVLNLQNLRVTIGTGILKSFPNYTIYPASDFLEEEPKFEVGKWYYVELGVHKHYLKFKKINKDNTFIDEKGYIKSLKEWDYGVSIDIEKVTFYRLLTDLSEIQQFLPDGHVDKIVKLISFPLEGCVYDDVNNLDNLSKYLINRPFNRPDNKVVKKDAVGIGWNTTSCWWLMSKTSGKTNYKLSDLESFLPKTEIIPEYVEYIDTKYKGKIVKVEDWCCGSYCKVIFYNGIKEQPFKHLVKPSTKEAYEAQNKPKQLNVKDLIKGEIYVFDINSTKNFISKFDYIESDNYYDSCFIQGNEFDNDPEFATISDIKSIRLATNEEKKWLNTCISQDKFISKEDLHLYDDSGLLIWEIGCYYKLNFTDNTSTYIKLSKKVDDRIYGNEYTDSTGKWYYNEIIWSTKQLKTHEKVDKPDQKIKDMFKKDDYIYVLGGETTTGKNCKDKVLKIESVDLKSLNKPFVTTDYDECGGIYFDEIRMATATEINTLYIHKKEEQDMKSILEEAKERYPIGTKFKCAEGGTECIVTEEQYEDFRYGYIAKDSIEAQGMYYVDYKGKWAEIISLPNEKWIPKIGDWIYAEKEFFDCRNPKYIPLFQLAEISKDNYLRPVVGENSGVSFKNCRPALPHEIPITSNCISYNGEDISKSFEVQQYYEFDGKSFNQDIYIAPITKKTKKLQTITIESTTDLNLNLTKIKSKQIQTIKI